MTCRINKRRQVLQTKTGVKKRIVNKAGNKRYVHESCPVVSRMFSRR